MSLFSSFKRFCLCQTNVAKEGGSGGGGGGEGGRLDTQPRREENLQVRNTDEVHLQFAAQSSGNNDENNFVFTNPEASRPSGNLLRMSSDLLQAEEDSIQFEVFHECRKICRDTSIKFEDPEFPPSLPSLGVFPSDLSLTLQSHDLEVCFSHFPPPSFLFDPSLAHLPAPGDVCQGALGDCWFLSVLAVIAGNEERGGEGSGEGWGGGESTSIIKNLFPCQSEANEEGVYLVKLCVGGRWRLVLLDGFFPFVRPRTAQEWSFFQGLGGGNVFSVETSSWRRFFRREREAPLFGAGLNEGALGNLLWVPLLEKALAKIYGDYFLLGGGRVGDAFTLLTGWPSIILELHRRSPQDRGESDLGGEREDIEAFSLMSRVRFSSEENVWVSLISHFNAGALMGAACGGGEERREEVENWGLMSNHAYSLLSIFDPPSVSPPPPRLIRLRNPWGKRLKGNWKGAFSEGSGEWTSSLKKLVAKTCGVPEGRLFGAGEFWMKFSDFCEFFSEVTISLFKPNWLEWRSSFFVPSFLNFFSEKKNKFGVLGRKTKFFNEVDGFSKEEADVSLQDYFEKIDTNLSRWPCFFVEFFEPTEAIFSLVQPHKHFGFSEESNIFLKTHTPRKKLELEENLSDLSFVIYKVVHPGIELGTFEKYTNYLKICRKYTRKNVKNRGKSPKKIGSTTRKKLLESFSKEEIEFFQDFHSDLTSPGGGKSSFLELFSCAGREIGTNRVLSRVMEAGKYLVAPLEFSHLSETREKIEAISEKLSRNLSKNEVTLTDFKSSAKELTLCVFSSKVCASTKLFIDFLGRKSAIDLVREAGQKRTVLPGVVEYRYSGCGVLVYVENRGEASVLCEYALTSSFGLSSSRGFSRDGNSVETLDVLPGKSGMLLLATTALDGSYSYSSRSKITLVKGQGPGFLHSPPLALPFHEPVRLQ